MTDKQVRQPEKMEIFSATGVDPESLRSQLIAQAQGRELYVQELKDEESDEITMYGYLRSQVLDYIYELAYPLVKILDDRSAVKVKSNRTVTDFFVIVQTRRSGNYIGKHGVTLDALETLISHSVSRHFPRWISLTVDVDNYRRKRTAYLEQLVRKVIRDIERDHRERKIRELLPKERKFIHQYFTNHPYLTTESRGEGRDRTLFILPRTDIREV